MKNNKFALIGIIIVLLIGGSYYAYNLLTENRDQEENMQQQVPPETESETDDKTVDSADNSDNSPKISARDFTVYDINNNEVHLSDFSDQPVVINFWASWCPPCRAEMDYFQEAYDYYSEKGVKFFMINSTDGSRETVETATAYFAENSYNMDIYFDMDFDAARNYDARSLPSTFFIDSKGNIANYHIGTTDKDTLFENIDNILD